MWFNWNYSLQNRFDFHNKSSFILKDDMRSSNLGFIGTIWCQFDQIKKTGEKVCETESLNDSKYENLCFFCLL